MSNELTQASLKEVITYYPETGLFEKLFITRRGNHIKKFVGHKTERGYIRLNISGRRYRAARVAFLYMVGRWPVEVEHINRDRSDNRWVNLEETTRAENTRNSIKPKKSGLPIGVNWKAKKNKWEAYIVLNKKRTYIGAYNSPEEAGEAYKNKAKELGLRIPELVEVN